MGSWNNPYGDLYKYLVRFTFKDGLAHQVSFMSEFTSEEFIKSMDTWMQKMGPIGLKYEIVNSFADTLSI